MPSEQVAGRIELLTSLLTIGQLKPGERLNVAPRPSISTATLVDRVTRTLFSSECREQSLRAIETLVMQAIELARADDKVESALVRADHGLHNLQVSYAGDAWAVCRLQVLRDAIETRERGEKK